jgi:flagellar basal body-associated protein FliL
MKKKLIMILVPLLLVGGVGAKMFLLPKKAAAKTKVDGTIYVLPKQFTLNLADGKYATLTVALVLAPGQSDGATAETAGQTTPAGFGTLTEEPVIRAIVTNDVTDASSKILLSAAGRRHVQADILRDIKKQTDVKVNHIYFTDLAVQ